MKTKLIKILMIVCVIAAVAGIPGVLQAIKIPPKEVPVTFINRKSHPVDFSCTVGYLSGSVMKRSDVDAKLSPGGTITKTAKHNSSDNRIFVAVSIYFNGQTFREDYNKTKVKKIVVTAMPGNYPQVKADFY